MAKSTIIDEVKELFLKTLLVAEGGDLEKALNYQRIKDRFDAMDDKEFYNFISEGNLRLISTPFESAFNLANNKKAMENVLGLKLEETFKVPFVFDDPELGAVITEQPCMALVIPVVKLIQQASGENRYASDIAQVDKTGEVVNKSKGAGINNAEAANLLSNGAENIVKELFTFRSGNEIAKKEAYTKITEEGRTNIPDAPIDGNLPLQYIMMCYYCMGIDSGFDKMEGKNDE